MRRHGLLLALLLAPSGAAAQGLAPAPAGPAAASAPAVAASAGRRPFEISPALGYGDAVCDKDKPDSDCPVDGAFALSVSGGWRFHDRFSVGLDLSVWSFGVRDAWRGQLAMPATEVKFSSTTIGPYGRWYWFRDGQLDPYLQAGIGFGSIEGEARNTTGSYLLKASGPTYHLGIGAEWQLTPMFRLGPQMLAYLHVSNEICETVNDGAKTCRSPGTNAMNQREGVALPYRLILVGTFTLGTR